jgi:hypothetical protein
MESQLLAGIDFFHPAFEAVLRRFCFCCQSNYESSSHNVASLKRCRKESVTAWWHFGLISVTWNVKATPLRNRTKALAQMGENSELLP